ALIDGAPTLGGQSVGAVIGTFCGLFSNGPKPYRTVFGFATDVLEGLAARDALSFIHGRRRTTLALYSEVALARLIEETVRTTPAITPLLGALLRDVARDGGRLRAATFATRHGDVAVRASGWIDASGDAALTWAAGFDCRVPETPVWGTNMMVLEGVDAAALAAVDRAELKARLAADAAALGLRRHDGFVFANPGPGLCLVNMTHIATPLDPLAASTMVLDGRHQADLLLDFFRERYPAAFAGARVRTYGQPGVRMTRWIKGRHHLTADEVRGEVRHDDAVARCSWPIELHDRPDDVHWEEFGDDHMHWVPLRSLIPEGADNLLAAGRCIDGDPAALSSVRVMGPCIATGAAAAHALDLAGAGSVAQVDIAALQTRLRDNLDRRD
ncbi:MAG: FAD-dependent oxidoreductase, partial [Rhodospirillales bacterium]|nr:FAD-dependent oxidoreductase [Rhodospirillales bacterium]